jgi:ABC-type dipeptide/oligopeptide/nickel transport system permease subunit
VLLSIVLAAMLGAGLTAVIVAIAVIDWTRFARVIRAETMLQSEMDYVAAARMLGMRQTAILLREVLPNVLPLILTLLSVEMGIAVVVEAILSFVGVSVTSDFPTWGGMIAEGRQVIHQAWWVLVLPTLSLVVVVVGFNLLGGGLRQVIDPAHR